MRKVMGKVLGAVLMALAVPLIWLWGVIVSLFFPDSL